MGFLGDILVIFCIVLLFFSLVVLLLLLSCISGSLIPWWLRVRIRVVKVECPLVVVVVVLVFVLFSFSHLERWQPCMDRSFLQFNLCPFINVTWLDFYSSAHVKLIEVALFKKRSIS